ncbi:MAG TPA: carotenoid oxygenase family protein [Blastocatellia bacterium]|nr:carotenoid oxygenase family protein [Blastocatellia bacterium]
MNNYAPLIERAFTLNPAAQSYTIEEIEGRAPAFLRGTYFLNGPARFEYNGFKYRHWPDGDGMVCALCLDHEGIRFTNRFTRSNKFVAEEEAGQPLFRTFGTAFEGDQLKRSIMLESPVNVSVYPCFGRLLAFGEQGLPWELDPLTLETRGPFTFGGAINEVTPFSAHPKFDRGEMVNFGVAGFWMLGISARRRGRKFFDQLVYCDWNEKEASSVYQAAACCYLGGEPILIADPNREDTGVVICQVFDARHGTGAFAIFDAFDVGRGPVATLYLKEPVHLGFRASFMRA